MDGLPTQYFYGKAYRLYPGERYFSRGTKRLHVEVWKLDHLQDVPQGFHIHHKDEDRWNNAPENLELREGSEHISYHAKELHKNNPEWSKEFQAKGIAAAPAWHKSKEGNEWHIEAAKKQAANREYKEHNCQQCGSLFSSRNVAACRTLFCSGKCKSAWRRASGIDNEIRLCAVCKKEFTVDRYAKTKTCSRSCADVVQARTKKGCP